MDLIGEKIIRGKDILYHCFHTQIYRFLFKSNIKVSFKFIKKNTFKNVMTENI